MRRTRWASVVVIRRERLAVGVQDGMSVAAGQIDAVLEAVAA